MGTMQQLAEGLQKIDERREKMDAIIRLVHTFFEQAGNIPSELPNGNIVTLRILDEPHEDGGSDQCLKIRGDVKHADPESEGDDYSFEFEITMAASGSVEIKSDNEYGKKGPFLFDMDRYSVADAFSKIVLEIEDNECENLGPHLRHVQRVIKQGMGMAPANGPKATP